MLDGKICLEKLGQEYDLPTSSLLARTKHKPINAAPKGTGSSGWGWKNSDDTSNNNLVAQQEDTSHPKGASTSA